jgi:hypothetical protein
MTYEEAPVMTTTQWSNPALEAELAYRRERLAAASGRSRGRYWLPRRRPSR